ncbi:hypothetical protein AOLI_G00040160 [Acnodon oligacanthus]
MSSRRSFAQTPASSPNPLAFSSVGKSERLTAAAEPSLIWTDVNIATGFNRREKRSRQKELIALASSTARASSRTEQAGLKSRLYKARVQRGQATGNRPVSGQPWEPLDSDRCGQQATTSLGLGTRAKGMSLGLLRKSEHENHRKPSSKTRGSVRSQVLRDVRISQLRADTPRPDCRCLSSTDPSAQPWPLTTPALVAVGTGNPTYAQSEDPLAPPEENACGDFWRGFRPRRKPAGLFFTQFPGAEGRWNANDAIFSVHSSRSVLMIFQPMRPTGQRHRIPVCPNACTAQISLKQYVAAWLSSQGNTT